MAQTIKLKRSATQNAVPSTSSLALGEIALNTYDGKLFIKKDVGGTESIVTIGAVGAGSIGPSELASTAVTAGSYGSTSAIPVITVDADGRITSASTATISGLSANSVTSTEIAANAVGISELNVSDGTDGQVLTTDGSGTLTFETPTGGAASANAFATNTASGNGSTATFTLSSTPSAESKIIAFINGVFQNQDAYTISGTDITFDTAPIAGTNNVVVYVIGDVYSGESVLISNFNGNGSTTAFTLSNNPGNENNTQVYIDGVYQQKTTYSVSGTTLTFSSAPPTGTANIEVVMLTSTTVNTPAAGSVVTASMADDSVTGAKLVSSAVTTAKIADANVTTAKIADANVTTAKIANDAVTLDKIADAVFVTESEGISSNDNDTTLPTSAAVKDYVDGKDFETGLAGDSGTGTVNTSQTLTVSGTANEVNTSVSGQTVTVGLPDSVSLTSNLTVGGYIAGPASFTIDPAGVGDNTGTVVIAGNLQVDGTQTIINSTSMSVDDLNLTLASGAANATAANGAGLTIDGASATLLYASSGDKFVFNKGLDVTGDGHDLLINSADYELVLLGNRGSTGVNLDKAYLRMKAEGTNTVVIDTAGNSYFNGGNIGIGTSSPKTTLNIAANDSGQGPILTLENTDTSITTGDVIGQIDFYANDGSTNGTGAKVNIKAVAQSSAGTLTELTFGTSPSTSATAIERMRIDAAGNVGIGTDNPSANLHVGNTNGAAELWLQRTDGYNAVKLYGSTLADGQGFKINVNNQDRFAIDSSGHVGIGTTGPTSKISVVGGAADPGISIKSGGNAGVDPFRVTWTNGAEGSMFIIDDSGKVGISTDSPQTLLQIVGSTNSAASSGGTLGIRQKGDGGGDGITITSSHSNSGRIYKDASGNLHMYNTGGNANDFVLSNTGNLGIGTDNPTEGKLHVKSDGAGEVELLTLENSTGTNGKTTLTFKTTSTDATKSAQIFAERINASGHTDLAFRTYNGSTTEHMRIDSSGNVGIGTNSPSTTLHISNDAGNAEVEILRLSHGDSDLTNGQASHAVALTFDLPSYEAGTTSNRLAAKIVGLKGVGGANDWHTGSSSTNYNGQLDFYTRQADVLTKQMTIDELGNVGIGHSDPSNYAYQSADRNLVIQSTQGARLVLLGDSGNTGDGGDEDASIYMMSDGGVGADPFGNSNSHAFGYALKNRNLSGLQDFELTEWRNSTEGWNSRIYIQGQSDAGASFVFNGGTSDATARTNDFATPTSDFEIRTTGSMTVPKGTTAQRPSGSYSGRVRFNTTLGKLEQYDGTVWRILATAYSIDYLILGGGGSGGDCTSPSRFGGGGGAGGLRTSYGTVSGRASSAENPLEVQPENTLTITVGAGASGGVTTDDTAGTQGNNSSISGGNFTTITALGGGGGGGNSAPATSGGSGGGGSESTGTGGAGTSGQGFNGGTGSEAADRGGGGGGTGAAGTNTDGGAGTSVSITGSAVTYGGGGASSGSGGSGGGAAGSTNGTANLGGGGGAAGTITGAGGSGVVILRMATADYSGVTTGSPTVTTSGSDTILRFTSSGTYTT